MVGGSRRDEQADDLSAPVQGASEADGLLPAEAITRGLLAGLGQYTQRQTAEASGFTLEDARRIWRAVGFPDVGDDRRVFTSADIAALADITGLITAGMIDIERAVELARPYGHLLSRLAAAQMGFVSEVLGERRGEEPEADDPLRSAQLAAQAVEITQELLPVLERTTLYVWRRHLATEAGRALLPAVGADTQDARRAVVGFIDISGFTRLSRGLPITELSALLGRFETVVADTVVAHGGRVIKNLGDEVLFVSDDPVAAAETALVVAEEVGADQRIPAVHSGLAFGVHTGLAFGPILHRGGDVFGPVVNIASRMTGLARRGTIRVDEAMANALGEARQFELILRAPRRVRGYSQLRSYHLSRA